MSNSTNSTVKSFSTTMPNVSETVFDPRLSKNTIRPSSLDLSCQSSKTSTESIPNSSSYTNSLPLPPRRRKERIYSLQGDEPPPRYLLGPKPSRYKARSADAKLCSDNQGYKLSMEIIPIIEVTKCVDVPIECTRVEKDNDDNFSLDDVFMENVDGSPVLEEPESDLVSAADDGLLKFIDDASPDPSDVETRISNTGHIESDVESQKSVRIERFDTDSQVDIQSESSLDTVATAIQVRERSTTIDSADALDLSEDNLFMIPNPSYESLTAYEVLRADDKRPVGDDANPKLAKDMKNKISKETTHRMSKNLAAEISDFFRSSASKLKPPCLDQARRDFANKKLRIYRDVADLSNKTPQRLIPRSPYITPVPMFEQRVSPRRGPSVKQPPFYVWNINSKNAAVCTTLNPSANHRTCANEESKALKDIENSTRKILELAKRPNGAPSRVSPTKTTERVAKSASTGQLPTKPHRDPNISHAQSNGLKPKSRPLYSFRNKPATKPRSFPSRLPPHVAPTWGSSPARTPHAKALKFPAKNLPKINIPLPSPQITVATVKTQVPCDFTTSPTTDDIDEARACTPEGRSVPSGAVPAEPGMQRSLLRKWRSAMQDLFRVHPEDFYIDGVQPCNNFKRCNTWPPKTNRSAADSSIYAFQVG